MKLRLKGYIYFDSKESMDLFIAESDAYQKLHTSLVYICGQAEGEPEGTCYLDAAYDDSQDTKVFFDTIKLRSKLRTSKIFLTTHICRLDPGEENIDNRNNEIKSYTYG